MLRQRRLSRRWLPKGWDRFVEWAGRVVGPAASMQSPNRKERLEGLDRFGLEIAPVMIWLVYQTHSQRASVDRGGLHLLTGLVAPQGYHAVEHIIKLYQYLFDPYYQFGLRPPPGLLPQATDWPIFLVHFWLNTFVTSLMALVLWRRAPVGLVRATVASLQQVLARALLRKLLASLAGLYVVYMSVVSAADNRISDTRPGPLGTAHAIRVEYYAEAILSANSLGHGIAVLNHASVRDAALP